MSNKRKIDMSFIPMPDALSYLGLLLLEHPIGFGWNTETHRLEYVSFGPELEVNEKVAQYLEDKAQVEKDLAKIHAAIQSAKEDVKHTYTGVAPSGQD